MRTRAVALVMLALTGTVAGACKSEYRDCSQSSDCCSGTKCYSLLSVLSYGMCLSKCNTQDWLCDELATAAVTPTPPVVTPTPPVVTPTPPVVTPTPPVVTPTPPSPPSTPAPPTESGDCTIYSVAGSDDNCANDCGKCRNPGSRGGVFVDEDKTGYNNQNKAYACFDWTFGSSAMVKGETEFNAANNENVYFGVGTYGASSQKGNLGMCYRMTVDSVDKDIIVQAVNTGGDVNGNQFDLQIGSGGFGAFNRCVGDDDDMFSGSTSVWGDTFGGTKTRSACSDLPQYPRDSSKASAAGDDLVKLCELSFDVGLRLEEQPGQGTNPTITHLSRVKCPDALVELTQLQRSDDPSGYTGEQVSGFPNTAKKCQGNGDWGNMAYCLTRMLDCKKPSASFIDNIEVDNCVRGRKVVQPCLIDGYTRIDVTCGCSKCWC